MRRVLEVKVLHHGVKYGPPEAVITMAGAISPAADVFPRAVHGFLVPGQELLGDRNKPTSSGISLGVTTSSGISLGVTHDKEPAPDFDVGLFNVPVLTDSASRIEKHEDMLYFIWHIINTAPQFIALAHSKRLFDMELFRLINIQVSGIVPCYEVVFGSILIQLFKQTANRGRIWQHTYTAVQADSEPSSGWDTRNRMRVHLL